MWPESKQLECKRTICLMYPEEKFSNELSFIYVSSLLAVLAKFGKSLHSNLHFCDGLLKESKEKTVEP